MFFYVSQTFLVRSPAGRDVLRNNQFGSTCQRFQGLKPLESTNHNHRFLISLTKMFRPKHLESEDHKHDVFVVTITGPYNDTKNTLLSCKVLG